MFFLLTLPLLPTEFELMPELTGETEFATIKNLVESGAVYDAALRLGHAFFLRGMVVEGNRIGRKLGFPTANLRPDPGQVIPGQGVYVGLGYVLGRWYDCMINIGIRPTLDLEQVTIEGHLLDFNQDIYGEAISFHFLVRIRDEMRFVSLGSLKNQLENDKIKSLQVLKELNLRAIPGEPIVWLNRKVLKQ